MFHKTCPWCGKLVAFPRGKPALRVTQLHRKWYQFSRSVSSCPFCGQPVQLAARGQGWILLASPVLFMPLCAAIFHLQLHLLSWYFALAAIAGVVGIILYLRETQLEKSYCTSQETPSR